QNCLPPPGFELGNSPGDFTPKSCAGKTIFMCTTNGTRAIVAAKVAAQLHVAAIVNARATAHHLIASERDVTLLCAGTNNQIATEDMLGAGTVIEAMRKAGGGRIHLVGHATSSHLHAR